MRNEIYAGLDLLDRQILDSDDELVGKVDDVELIMPEDGGAPRVAALLVGSVAYGGRLGGRLGRWISGAGARLTRTEQPIRIPVDLIEELGISVRLGVPSSDLEGVEDFDHWLRDHFIGRIPGAKHASE